MGGNSPSERDIEQAITTLKKGATLLKYGRRGRPKFAPFQLSNDESSLIWYSGKVKRHIKLDKVLGIIPGQQTATFRRYPRPDKEYLSFSLICSERSLDLICKDKEEAEVWFVGLKALVSDRECPKWRTDAKDIPSSKRSMNAMKFFRSFASSDPGELQSLHTPKSQPQIVLGKAFSDLSLYTATSRGQSLSDSGGSSFASQSEINLENCNNRISASDSVRLSLSSHVSSSSQGSFQEDFDSLGDVFHWGEGLCEGILGGGKLRVVTSTSDKIDALLPKALESTIVLDVNYVACGGRHAALITKQGEIFSWGEESGGRLGHGAEVDVPHPKQIDSLTSMNIELVACGEYHTCAVSLSGDLFTWGDGTRNSGLLGHGSEASHWVPKKVCGPLEGLHISFVSCGPWHTAVLTSAGQLFTFGDGTFGALGHGDRSSIKKPKEVGSLVGLRTVRVACGGWHTAAIVEMVGVVSATESLDGTLAGKLFTWGDNDSNQLGHGDKEASFIPICVTALEDLTFSSIACGRDFTVGLTTSGRVYTMGSTKFGQLGNPKADGKIPVCVKGKIGNCSIEEIACGSHHVAALTSKAEVYTWGRGTNGQLGHGDTDNRKEPTLIDSLRDKQVKSISCGTNFTVVICLHKWVTSAENSSCTSCHTPFNFRRKRHNCYNCGLVFCKGCSIRKSLRASLAPSLAKPYRVCDSCYTKLKKPLEPGQPSRIPRPASRNSFKKSSESLDKETPASSKLLGQISRQISRLTFVDTPRRNDSRVSKSGVKLEKSRSSVSSGTNGSTQLGLHPSASPPHFGATSIHASVSTPGSKVVSGASSPVSSMPRAGFLSCMPYLGHSASFDGVVHGSVHQNSSSREEVADLRAQVENLTHKIQSLESELHKRSRQLKEAKAAAADEVEKSRAAKDVIRSLTTQLKERVQRSNGGGITVEHPNASDAAASPASENFSLSSVAAAPRIEPTLANGTKPHSDKSERIIQDEPGVYVTLVSLPGGSTELKRVRFSRKRFTEEEAEKWWADHGDRVYDRHNVQRR